MKLEITLMSSDFSLTDEEFQLIFQALSLYVITIPDSRTVERISLISKIGNLLNTRYDQEFIDRLGKGWDEKDSSEA